MTLEELVFLKVFHRPFVADGSRAFMPVSPSEQHYVRRGYRCTYRSRLAVDNDLLPRNTELFIAAEIPHVSFEGASYAESLYLAHKHTVRRMVEVPYRDAANLDELMAVVWAIYRLKGDPTDDT